MTTAATTAGSRHHRLSEAAATIPPSLTATCSSAANRTAASMRRFPLSSRSDPGGRLFEQAGTPVRARDPVWAPLEQGTSAPDEAGVLVLPRLAASDSVAVDVTLDGANPPGKDADLGAVPYQRDTRSPTTPTGTARLDPHRCWKHPWNPTWRRPPHTSTDRRHGASPARYQLATHPPHTAAASATPDAPAIHRRARHPARHHPNGQP